MAKTYLFLLQTQLLVNKTLTISKNLLKLFYFSYNDGLIILQLGNQRRLLPVITGNTVVLTCCKADFQGQWKHPYFRLFAAQEHHHHHKLYQKLTNATGQQKAIKVIKHKSKIAKLRATTTTPLPISIKRRGLCQICFFCTLNRGGGGVVIPGVYFYPFYFLTYLLTCLDRIVCRRTVDNDLKDVFPRILVPIRGLAKSFCCN